MKKAEAVKIIFAAVFISALASGCQPVALQPSFSAETAAPPAASAAESPSAAPQASAAAPAVSPAPTATPSAAPQSAPASSPAAQPSPAVSAAPPAGQEAFPLVEKTYRSGAISIRYPQISGYSDRTLQDKLNQMIEDSALRDLPFKDNTPEEYTITDTVALNSPGVISVYFDGYVSMKDSAHPSQFFYSVTIDVKKLETVTLPQLVAVGPGFVNLLSAGDFRSAGYDMTDDTASAIKEYIGSMDSGFWAGELSSADAQGSDAFSFLTKDALGISVAVPHVLGDHIEILVKFGDLHGFQTDNPVWKAVETPSSAGMPNPVHESTAEEILNTLGMKFHIPGEARAVRYFVVDSGQDRIAQAVFTLGDTEYTCRIQSAAAFADISGAHCDWASKREIDVSYCKGEVRCNDGKQGVCLWYDTVPGLMYSLYADDGASEDGPLNLANRMFVPAE